MTVRKQYENCRFRYKNNQNDPKIISKSIENYVSAQVGCLGLLDSYRFLNSGLDKLVKSLDNFPILDSNNFKGKSLEDDLLKKKLAYPYVISKND